MTMFDGDHFEIQPQEAAPGVLEHRTPKKFFTLEEANRALGYVSRVVEDLVACYLRLKTLRGELDLPASAAARPAMEDEYEKLMARLSGLVDELHFTGVELKDFERGLVDFPAIHQEREICLCWQRGETAVLAWHDSDAGFAGRRDVAELQLSSSDEGA